MNNFPEQLTVTQAARHLGVHRRTVDRLVLQGRLDRDGQTLKISQMQVERVKLERAGILLHEEAYQWMKSNLIFRLLNERFGNLSFEDSLPF